MSRRSLKVYSSSGYNYQSVPCIFLKGKWLDKLGFHISDKITVQQIDNEIMIMKEEGASE